MDEEKRKKLMAGRKKLQKYQQEKTKNKKEEDNDSHSISSSSENQASTMDFIHSHEANLQSAGDSLQSVPQIQTYFAEPDYPPFVTSSFFDSPGNNYNHYTNGSEVQVSKADSLTYEDPEINPNEIYDLHKQQADSTEKVSTCGDLNEFSNISSTENLRQLSSQINQLIEPSYENQNNFSDLEKRNLELASLYENEKLKREQTQVELEESKSRIARFEKELQKVNEECENRMKREFGPLQEQLQCHMQTVGILVGEKTELTASLNQYQIFNKQKTAECDDLQARLKTSRSRVADLEKDLSMLKEEKQKVDMIGSEFNVEQSKLKSEFDKLHETNAEAQQDIKELREKLKIVTGENSHFQNAIKELKSHLNLAEVKIQQLTVVGSSQEIDKLVEEKIGLEKQVADLNLMVKNAVNERDQASNQYQSYVQQLNNSLSNLAQKLEFTLSENDGLKKREEELIKHIGELEKRLNSFQSEHINFSAPIAVDNTKVDLESTTNQLSELQQQYYSLEEKFKDLIGERDELLSEIESKKEAINELELTIERLQSNQADNTKLLATIESDKVAASRAVQQNTQLKQQLEEMQEAFIKMTNDKAELVDKITSEQYKQREADEKFQQASHQLNMLKDAINIKDHELMEMRENSMNLNKQVLQQNQLTDRLRHYEANEHGAHALTSDLQQAIQEIERLKVENQKLKEHEHDHHDHDHHDHDHHDHDHHDHDHNHDEHDNHEEEDALQLEIFNLKQKLDAMQIENEHLQSQLTKASGNSSEKISGEESTSGKTSNTSELNNDHLHDINKELAMRQLEAKFMRTMQDIANLQDEKQMLEHLVMQLQGETETIGEYIALYQHQRGVLKQRASEKETQLKQLSKDREQMKKQINRLNDLVRRLVSESGTPISSEVLQQHEALQKQTYELCEEHAKLHGEMQDTDPKETAEQIIALLSEIKTSNLVQPADVSETFHPCPWCSGQLITV